MKLLGTVIILVASILNVYGKPLEEDFGYVDVRPGAHMFWVVYHTELPGDWSGHPMIMWLQGGPGSSGVGFGNFKELGPYDMEGNLREGRWTKKANVMFVDNPVGTGYSYVDDLDLLCTDNMQIANDLVVLLKSVFTLHPDMEKMPFFVYAESYGGKMTADFALALDKAIKNNEINCNFQGIAMGDSWISPMDSINTWGTYLYWMGFVNEEERAIIDRAAAQTQKAVDELKWVEATVEWDLTEVVIMKETDGVDLYNVLTPDSATYAMSSAEITSFKNYSFMKPEIRDLYFRHVVPFTESLTDFMNGPQAKRWDIPDDVVWNGQGSYVFHHLAADFMKPVVESVANLLKNSNIHVAVYTGNLDLICDTPGTYMWIDNMDYPQKNGYNKASRQALTVPNYPNNAAYVQRFERFSVFTLLRSGHMVPMDVPNMALEMIDIITRYGKEAVEDKMELRSNKNIGKDFDSMPRYQLTEPETSHKKTDDDEAKDRPKIEELKKKDRPEIEELEKDGVDYQKKLEHLTEKESSLSKSLKNTPILSETSKQEKFSKKLSKTVKKIEEPKESEQIEVDSTIRENVEKNLSQKKPTNQVNKLQKQTTTTRAMKLKQLNSKIENRRSVRNTYSHERAREIKAHMSLKLPDRVIPEGTGP